MKFKGVVAVFMICGSLQLMGQGTEHRFYDLYAYVVEEEYEKCVKKALRVVSKEKNYREPLPYLYLSMAYSYMYDSKDYRLEYPRLLKDACSAAAKYRKKDKADLFVEQNKDFFEDLRVKSKQAGYEEFEEQKYSKARSWFYKTVKFFPEDYGAWTLLAVSEYFGKNKAGGDEAMAQMKQALDRRYRHFAMPDADVDFFKGMELYSQYLTQIGQSDSARASLNWANETIAKSDEKRRESEFHRF